MDGNKPDEIDQFFKDSLHSFREKPPEGVWENIEQGLNDDDRRGYLKRMRYFLLASACLIGLCFSLGLLFRPVHSTVRLSSAKTGAGVNAGSVEDGGGKSSGDRQLGGSGDPGRLVGVPGVGRDDRLYGVQGGGEQGHISGAVERTARPAWSVSRQPLLSTPSISEPDPDQRLLNDQIGKLKKASRAIAPQLPSRWSVTGYFSKEFAGYNLSDHDSTGANGREIDKKERSVFSASAGIFFGYKLKGNWVIQSGLGYSWSNSIANPTTSYAVKDNNGNIRFQINTVSGYGYLPASTSGTTQVGDSVLTDKSHTSLRYLSMPLMVSREFQLKRLRFLAGVGVTASLLTSATLTSKIQGPAYTQQESVVRMYGLEKLNYGVALKTEMQYPLFPGWWIDLMVSFKNTLSPINLHSTLSTYPYNLGIGLGISHSF
jgi:hypothetical protein